MGCHLLLQRIFLTQGLDPYLLHWPAGSLPTSATWKALDYTGAPLDPLIYSHLQSVWF